MRSRLLQVALVTSIAFTGGFALAASATLDREASWTIPDVDQVKADLTRWLDQGELNDDVRQAIDARWTAAKDSNAFELLLHSLADADPRAKELIDFCSKPRQSFALPTFDVLSDETTSPFVRNNLKLLFGRWLATNHLFNEALDTLADLEPADVVDPATLLFYKSVAHHRLLDKKSFLPTIKQLMENREQIPHRYVTLATLMEADLKPLKSDSLDEISRLMDNIQVRLGHGRAGKRVRQEEDDVIAKLDKMIEKMEQQQRQGGS